MTAAFSLPVTPGEDGLRRISPTDISQFIRLDQCQRYLRLRLHERAAGSAFLSDYGVAPQSIPPLLTRAGERFEQLVERAAAARWPALECKDPADPLGQQRYDNQLVVERARDLPAGQTLLLLQPRLRVALGSWLLRGDIDILRLERDQDGALDLLIADMKSSTSAKIEHRLQVAFYHEMLRALFEQAGLPYRRLEMAILYRGPLDGGAGLSPQEQQELERQRAAAGRWFGSAEALLEHVENPESYCDAVDDLVTGQSSTAERVSQGEFEQLPFHLTYKCDGCLYNELCMKRSAEREDLSILPHLTAQDKRVLLRAGVQTVDQLATLKQEREDGELAPAPGREALVRTLSTTWPVGPRLDELIQRARGYRAWKEAPLSFQRNLPSKGYGSLPYSAADHNPNMVRVYIDAQHDYLQDRIYLIGALVVCCEDGLESPERRRAVVHMTEGPPETGQAEEQLLLGWIRETLKTLVELAAPDQEGQPRAPIHLIFFNSYEQRLLLDALSRHAGAVLGATPLYDFLTQLAAFDSPIATFLDQEIRELKNYPMVCQSLQSVAAYLGFKWNEDQPYREIFRTRLFDSQGKWQELPAGQSSPWYTRRARFSSQLPLEYAYAAWGALPDPARGKPDDFASYRRATPELLRGFQARRLEALEHIVHDFRGNQQTQQRAFELPALASFSEQARTLAQSLREFVAIERHVTLNAWKSARLAPPERRMLAGDTLIIRYEEADQDPALLERVRENERRRELKRQMTEAARAARPELKQPRLTPEQKAQTALLDAAGPFSLRLDLSGVECELDEALGLTTIKQGDRLVLFPRFDVDSRLPPEEQVEYTPTPRQLLYGMRLDLQELRVERDAAGRATAARAIVRIPEGFGGSSGDGFSFSSIRRPLESGKRYSLDEDPNDFYGSWAKKVVEGLCQGQPNTLYQRLVDEAGAQSSWLDETSAGQARFLTGLDALLAAGALHGFEQSKRDFIGGHGATPILLVQGPPGTGKSYSTAFALLARIQGAMTEGKPYRVVVSCKTHAATDVLLANIARVLGRLRELRSAHPALFEAHFDPRLLELALLRRQPREALPEGVIGLPKDDERPEGAPRSGEVIQAHQWCILAATPGGIYRMLAEHNSKNLFGQQFCDCLVLDEASQMNLPEALMAALALKPDGQLIVVGDHRQMPPIVKHDWSSEPRRTFKQYRAYESLFVTLLERQPPMIKFEESFRLHADMAEFLRREIYQADQIPYFSQRRQVLPALPHADGYLASVLSPEHPLVVVVHEEQESQLSNRFELALIRPVLEALAERYGLGAERGLGVVVPHRAQRALLQEAVPCLTIRDSISGSISRSAVDTVERFQGDEREVILVSATESDQEFLLASSQFLLDPRRLTVALSRSKQKMILVASRSVFSLFSADEATFANARLWKNLLRRTCTAQLWQGQRDGRGVQVWGNEPGR